MAMKSLFCFRRRIILPAAITIASSMLIAGCGSFNTNNASSSDETAAAICKKNGANPRNLAKAEDDIRRLCSLDAKCTSDDAARTVKDLEIIAGDAANPLQPFVLCENLTTQTVYASQGDWSTKRRKMHEDIVQSIFANATKATDRGATPLLRLTGGGSGSGKSWCTKRFLQEAQSQSSIIPIRLAVIDSDEIKSRYIQEYQNLTKLRLSSAADQVHTESSFIARKAVAKAIDEGYDAILDSTLKTPAKAIKLVNQAHERGARVHLRGIFVKPETALERAAQRGKLTGRFVPRSVIIRSHKGFATTFPELLKVLDFAKGDHAELYNFDVPEGTDPILVYRDGIVVNNKLWDSFLKIKDLPHQP